MKWYLKVLKQYADFNGRARRKEYWMYILFYIIFLFVAQGLDIVFGISMDKMGYGPISAVFIVAHIIPSIAVTVRRLHDSGRSGWMYLICFIPFIGAIWLFVLTLLDGTPVENMYGPNPKDLGEL